jgi:asparagine synthase (glutamine-hydrolysing)
MKAAVADLLPRDILERKKRGFGAPMGAWLKGELAPLTRELLSPRAVAARHLFDPAEVSALIAAHEANRVDGTDRLLALLNLEVWCRIFLDGHAPGDVASELKALASRGMPARITA